MLPAATTTTSRVPGVVDAAHQGGILSHVPAGKGAYGNIDDADLIPLLIFPDPAETGVDVGSKAAPPPV